MYIMNGEPTIGAILNGIVVDTVIQGNAVMMLTLNGQWWYDFAGAEYFFC